MPPGGPVTFIKVRRGWLAQNVGVEYFNFTQPLSRKRSIGVLEPGDAKSRLTAPQTSILDHVGNDLVKPLVRFSLIFESFLEGWF